jgi:hypothetical protein
MLPLEDKLPSLLPYRIFEPYSFSEGQMKYESLSSDDLAA